MQSLFLCNLQKNEFVLRGYKPFKAKTQVLYSKAPKRVEMLILND